MIDKIKKKYEDLGENPETYLEGLLWSKPTTYWDYVKTDALLGLQIQRTTLPDEMIFIVYHQINELIFKMIISEIDQIGESEDLQADFFIARLGRIGRYFDLLSGSFNIMGDGMEVSQYMKFRNTLTPASGFQSAQYRTIEFGSTELINLIDYRFRKTIDQDTPFEHAFEHLYWQAAGKNYETGEKSLLMNLFEGRYKDEFINTMKKYNETNLWTKFKQLPEETKKSKDLINAMRHLDHTINVRWVMAHLHAAEKYLDSGEETAEATGGSDWKKYMHPRYQRRIFFPELWSKEELETWGVDNLEECIILK